MDKKEEDVRKLSDTLKDLHSSRDLQNAEAVYELMFRLNKDKKWSREERNTMGYLRDLFKEEFEMRDKKIEQQSEQLEQKDVQLEQKDAQLEQKDAKIIDLQARIAELEAELNKKTRIKSIFRARKADRYGFTQNRYCIYHR